MANSKNKFYEILKSKWLKIGAIVLACLMFLISILAILNTFAPNNPRCYHSFGLSGLFGDFDKSGNPKTYYQAYYAEDYVEYVTVKVNKIDNANVKEIWINVSDMYDKSIKIYTRHASDSLGTLYKVDDADYILDAKTLSKDVDGWICLYMRKENDSLTASTYHFGFQNQIKVRELVFVDVNNKVMTYNVNSYTRRVNSDINETGSAGNIDKITLDQAKSLPEGRLKDQILSMNKLNDEQDTFKKKK